jgi:hypothetical protein
VSGRLYDNYALFDHEHSGAPIAVPDENVARGTLKL